MEKLERNHPNRQVIPFLLMLFWGQVLMVPPRYTILEETERGSFVAHLAKDLGLRLEELAARSAQVVSDYDKQQLILDPETGDLLLREKLDREELCGSVDPCVLHFQVFIENPVQFFQGELLIQDINDHSPEFPDTEMLLKIRENSQPGTQFSLKLAQDLDVGSNGIQQYRVSPNSHFHVLTRNNSEGKKYPELVQDRGLDREEQEELSLTLTAVDGGSPPRSGTTMVRILILDINDNAPEFVNTPYEVQVLESSPPDSPILTVSARDADAGNFGRPYLPLPEVARDPTHDDEDVLTLYLVIALASVSSLFLLSVLLFVGVRLCRRARAAPLGVCSVPEGHFPGHLVDISGEGTLSQSYQYEVCLTGDSGTGEFKFLKPVIPSLLVQDSGTDCFSQPYLPLPEVARDPAQDDEDLLTLYLVIALASVSSLFLLSVLLFVGVRLCRRSRSASLGVCSVPEGHVPGHLVDINGEGTLSQSYQYEVCLTGNSGTGEFKFLKPVIPSLLVQNAGGELEENLHFRDSFVFS
ncbi:protocadherin beta-4-like [Psammomys obesus]|uniref:protocadherin beta-4-like n=1 Tax=Psammomys obesus TaxID=48139 RepID=UPI002452FF9B|nr:protocadherin beta-4-like [Psammomys obesus]